MTPVIRRPIAFLRGSDSGQSIVEYLTRAALLTIGGKTSAEYDRELEGLAKQVLDLSGYDEIVQAREERERQTASQRQ